MSTAPTTKMTTTCHYHVVIEVSENGLDPTLFSNRWDWADAIHRGYITIGSVSAVTEPPGTPAPSPASADGPVDPGDLLAYKVRGAPKVVEPTEAVTPPLAPAYLLDRLTEIELDLERMNDEMRDRKAADAEISARVATANAQLTSLTFHVADLTQQLNALAERGR